MNRMALVATLLWLCSLAGALAQEPTREIPRDSTADLEPVLRYPLPEGALLHAQYDGEMMRVDGAGKRLAKAKIPDSHRIASSTVLVVSSNFSNVLMIHRADDSEFRANHRVWLFELGHLKKVREFPLGRCESSPLDRTFPAVTDRVTMLCYHSRSPDDPKRKPTSAVVTVDLNRGEVVRWSPLGGERRGSWLGPMFFGWNYDVRHVDVVLIMQTFELR